MGVLDILKKALLTRVNDLVSLLIVVAGKLGVKVALFHVYTIHSPAQALPLPADEDAITVRHDIASSRPNEELLSIWDGGQRIGGLDLTNESHYVNHIRTCVAFDGWYMFNLGIVKPMRSRGYAKRLIEESLRTHPGERMYAMVAFANTPSRKLMESCGFTREDPIVYINILGRGFRNSRSRRYLRPVRMYPSNSSGGDVPIDRSL
ncbi:MAG: GNAT family N-acetyltransferase [Methanomassiliicoccus sp.]|nr:GNAT family N-acetyltransferase [Methanomassiliicoccus sp.]